MNPLSEYELQLFTNPFQVLGKKRRKTVQEVLGGRVAVVSFPAMSDQEEPADHPLFSEAKKVNIEKLRQMPRFVE